MRPGAMERRSAPSSRGLGHHPLKVATRVRIPLGLQKKSSSERNLGARSRAPKQFAHLIAQPFRYNEVERVDKVETAECRARCASEVRTLGT